MRIKTHPVLVTELIPGARILTIDRASWSEVLELEPCGDVTIVFTVDADFNGIRTDLIPNNATAHVLLHTL